MLVARLLAGDQGKEERADLGCCNGLALHTRWDGLIDAIAFVHWHAWHGMRGLQAPMLAPTSLSSEARRAAGHQG